LETSADIVQEAMRLGAWGYVFKLHAEAHLLLAIDSVLSGKRFISSAQPLQFGHWCYERGRAAIQTDLNFRKYKDPDFVRILNVRKMDIHLGRKLCTVAGCAK